MSYRVVDDQGLAVAAADRDSAGRFTVIADDEPELEHDPVEHPAHYTSSAAACTCGRRIECIDVVQHMPFNVGNAVKYLWRLGLKGDTVEDLRKARQYIEFEIGRRSR